MKIMYVCEPCWNAVPESCGHFERDMLRVMPDQTWVCEECHGNAEDLGFEKPPRWQALPIPPRYVPEESAK